MGALFSGPKLPKPRPAQPLPTPDEAVEGVTPDGRKRLAAALSTRQTLLTPSTPGLSTQKATLGA